MITATTIPNIYSAGYSAVPLRLNDNSGVNTIENYKYIVNIVYNKETILSSQSTQYNNYVYTQLNYSLPHNYKIGDNILLIDGDNLYTDYYDIVALSTYSIVINLTLQQSITATTTTSNTIKYPELPSPTGDVRLDLGNTLKDFVTQNLSVGIECMPAPDTRFEYDIIAGYEGRAVFNFNDDAFGLSGGTAFINTGLTNVNQVDFQIGDEIIIARDLEDWNYTDNYYDGLFIGFTSTTEIHNFTTGDTVTITGQITAPNYNGVATVYSVPDANGLVVTIPYTVNTPTEGGVIYGVVNPSYNTTATIRNIYYQTTPLSGVCIETYIPIGISTQPIAGTIKHRDGRFVSNLNQYSLTGLNVFNSYVNNENYDIDFMEDYVIKGVSYTLNNLSTILANPITSGNITQTYRIEKSTKSWLLCHNYIQSATTGTMYEFFDVNENTLCTSFIENISDNKLDYYSPVGLDQIIASNARTDNTPLSGVVSQIHHYLVNAAKLNISNIPVRYSNGINFYLNEDCAGYQLFHLMWKDSLGSWLSYPFKYMSQDSMNVDRKTYYANSGNWRDSSFDYDSFDKGETTFFTRSRKSVTLNTGWIEAYENALIEDLMKSTAIYVQTPDNVLLAGTIQNKDITFGNVDNQKVWQYNFQVSYSNDEVRF